MARGAARQAAGAFAGYLPDPRKWNGGLAIGETRAVAGLAWCWAPGLAWHGRKVFCANAGLGLGAGDHEITITWKRRRKATICSRLCLFTPSKSTLIAMGRVGCVDTDRRH